MKKAGTGVNEMPSMPHALKASWTIWALKSLLGLFLLCQQATVMAEGRLFFEAYPAPDFLPREVVRIQMQALASPGFPLPDIGAQLAYRFASPMYRAMTGPPESFRQLLDSPAYSPLLGHRSRFIGEPIIAGNTATVPVWITGGNGQSAAYIFFLSKQSLPPYADCWMTEWIRSTRPPVVYPSTKTH